MKLGYFQNICEEIQTNNEILEKALIPAYLIQLSNHENRKRRPFRIHHDMETYECYRLRKRFENTYRHVNDTFPMEQPRKFGMENLLSNLGIDENEPKLEKKSYEYFHLPTNRDIESVFDIYDTGSTLETFRENRAMEQIYARLKTNYPNNLP